MAAKYRIEEKLNELDQLVQEADDRSESSDDLRDVWRYVHRLLARPFLEAMLMPKCSFE